MSDTKKQLNVLEKLIERGFIATSTVDGEEKLAITDFEKTSELLTKGTTIYQGFDPSGDSLHLGHLESIMALHHLQEAGNKIIFLLGGATGRVGDPTDKKSSRVLLTQDVVAENAKALKKQVEGMGLLSFEDGKTIMLNNDTWISKETFMDFFLMGIARYFSVNDMVKMDTFQKRLTEGKHLSLMEFLYPTLQAWDFLHLFKKYGCAIQAGGQDQWGNMLQGTKLIKAHEGNEANAQVITFPLLLTSNGEKMGKTEKGPLWLDPEKTSPFDFYQYLEKTSDDMVEKLFKLFTFLEIKEIEKIMKGSPRDVQKKLAFKVTKIVHGEKEALKAQNDSEKLFSSSTSDLSGAIPDVKIDGETTLEDIIIKSGALQSKSEIRRRSEQGGVRVDGEKVLDPKELVSENCTIQYGKSKFLNVVVEK